MVAAGSPSTDSGCPGGMPAVAAATSDAEDVIGG